MRGRGWLLVAAMVVAVLAPGGVAGSPARAAPAGYPVSGLMSRPIRARLTGLRSRPAGVVGEPAAAGWFRAASPATVQVWVVPHAGHTQALVAAPQVWENQVISFLDTALNPAP